VLSEIEYQSLSAKSACEICLFHYQILIKSY
jgi:hypothetical protein